MFILSKQFDWAKCYAADYNAPPKTKADPTRKTTRLEKARALTGETIAATELYRLDIIRRNWLKELVATGRIVPVGRLKSRVPIIRVADIVSYYEASEPPRGYVPCMQWADENYVERGTLANAVKDGKFSCIVVEGIRYANPKDMQAWNSARAAKVPDGYMRCHEWLSRNGVPKDVGRKLVSQAPIKYIYVTGAKCAKVSDMELHFKPKPSQDRAS